MERKADKSGVAMIGDDLPAPRNCLKKVPNRRFFRWKELDFAEDRQAIKSPIKVNVQSLSRRK